MAYEFTLPRYKSKTGETVHALEISLIIGGYQLVFKDKGFMPRDVPAELAANAKPGDFLVADVIVPRKTFLENYTKQT